MNNVLYTAYRLSDSSRKIVKSKFDLSEYKTIYADHQTIEFFGAKIFILLMKEKRKNIK